MTADVSKIQHDQMDCDKCGQRMQVGDSVVREVFSDRTAYWHQVCPGTERPEPSPLELWGDGDRLTGTMVKLGDNLAMRWPPEAQRGAFIVGQHRLVPAYYDQGDGADLIWIWMCFDHGWDCWVTEAARSGPQP